MEEVSSESSNDSIVDDVQKRKNQEYIRSCLENKHYIPWRVPCCGGLDFCGTSKCQAEGKVWVCRCCDKGEGHNYVLWSFWLDALSSLPAEKKPQYLQKGMKGMTERWDFALVEFLKIMNEHGYNFHKVEGTALRNKYETMREDFRTRFPQLPITIFEDERGDSAMLHTNYDEMMYNNLLDAMRL